MKFKVLAERTLIVGKLTRVERVWLYGLNQVVLGRFDSYRYWLRKTKIKLEPWERKTVEIEIREV